MNISFRLLFPTLILLSCTNSFAMLPGLEEVERAEKYVRESRLLLLIAQEADKLDQVLTRDEEFYDASVSIKSRPLIPYQQQLLQEFVSHVYLIAPTRNTLALIKHLTMEDKADLKALELAIQSLAPLSLKYVKKTFEWAPDQDTIPVHSNAKKEQWNSQNLLVQCSTDNYRNSMQELLNACKNESIKN